MFLTVSIIILVFFIISSIGFDKFISFTNKKFTQPIRVDGPQSHCITKKNTPTMGGLVIYTILLLSYFFIYYQYGFNWQAYCFIFLYSGFAIIGFVDDYTKLEKNNHMGISGKTRLIFEIIIATAVVLLIQDNIDGFSYIFFSKEVFIDLKQFYIPYAIFTIVASANATNITDGLDGLVSIPTILSLIILMFIAITTSFISLDIVYIIAITIGVMIGFLWVNCNPARIFLGDVGSLPLGAIIAYLSIITKSEIPFIIMNLLQIIEVTSVILQVGYFKLTKGKRIFKMTPIHHHFELLGWSENKVVVRFWIISILSGLIATGYYYDLLK